MTTSDDFQQSLNRALVRQGWLFGEKFNRIGNPFTWVDGDQLPALKSTQGVAAILQYLSMSGEVYETPEGIRVTDHDTILEDLTMRLTGVFSAFAPFLEPEFGFERYIASTASVKLQDYCAIRTWCEDLGSDPVHLDIGPGLGANALYSCHHLGASYIGTDAYPTSLAVQRAFFRQAFGNGYLDVVDAENFGLSEPDIAARLLESHWSVTLLPSWHLELSPDESVDLISATWVLNEVTPAGICWLLHHIARLVRQGGYVYLRDSERRKPLRHDLDYDKALRDLGFEQAGRLDIRNRIDMHGIPRVYRRTGRDKPSFEDLFEAHFGRFAITAHGANHAQDGSPS